MYTFPLSYIQPEIDCIEVALFLFRIITQPRIQIYRPTSGIEEDAIESRIIIIYKTKNKFLKNALEKA